MTPPMTTSPESRAKEIVSRALAVDAAVNLGTDYLESLIAAAIREAENAKNDEVRDFWRAWAAKRLDIQHRHWMRAAKRALDGDLRELRLRVDLAEAPPVAIVASTQHKD